MWGAASGDQPGRCFRRSWGERESEPSSSCSVNGSREQASEPARVEAPAEEAGQAEGDADEREGGGEDALESLTFVGGEDEPEEEEAASPSVVKMRVRVGDTVLDLESQAIGIVKGTLAGELSVLWESESSIKVNRAEVQPLAEAIAEKLEGGGRSIKGVTFRGNSTLRKLMELFGYRAVKRLNKDSLRKVWNQLDYAVAYRAIILVLQPGGKTQPVPVRTCAVAGGATDLLTWPRPVLAVAITDIAKAANPKACQ